MADGGANGPDYAVDLSNCDREPIHVLGKVQPFGFLIALTADWLVARASAPRRRFSPLPFRALAPSQYRRSCNLSRVRSL